MTATSALITGASRGIGLGIATRLASRGYALTISGRDPARLNQAATDLMEAGASDVIAVAGDMADPRTVDALLEAHLRRSESLHTLVLNAGVGSAGTIEGYPLRRFDKTLEVNLRAPFALLQAALPLLRRGAKEHPDRGAKVVALASITGVYAEHGLAAYGATKAALLSLVEAFNVEESDNGVSATALAPGYVDTDMAAWTHDRIPAETMIKVADIVELVDAILCLSATSVVSKIVIRRAGSNAYLA